MLPELFQSIQHTQQKFTRQRDLRYWLSHGRIPWDRGYIEAKEQAIQTALANQALIQKFAQQQALPDNYSSHLDERLVEFPWLIARLPAASGQVLDAGSTINHDYILNQPIWKNKDITIMTLAPEIRSFWERKISYVWGDLRHNPFRDNWFDVVTCISTLEHVGMDNSIYTTDTTFHEDDRSSYLKVIGEFQRILKPGGRFYLTVPYGIYKQCGFQQVFNAEMIAAVIAAFGGQLVEQSFFQYFPTGWQKSTQAACADCDYFNIHVTKQIEPDYAAAARAVACLILQK